MNLKRIVFTPLLGATLLVLAIAQGAERFLLEPILPSSFPPQSSVAPSVSGGNVESYPNSSGSVPQDTSGTFFLAESSIGYCGPTSEGGMNTRTELNAAALSSLNSGTHYKTVGVPGNWQIVFPGVIDLATGNQAPGSQNFHADRVQQSVDYYRAVAHAFPTDIEARINFINALRDLMVPYSFAGNNAYARATKERVISGPLDIPPAPGQPDPANPTASDREDAVLQNACGMYDLATEQFISLMGEGDSFNAAFSQELPEGLDESNPQIVELRSAQKLLCSTFAKAMGFKGETLLRSFQLRYFKNYTAPTLTNSSPAQIEQLLENVADASLALDLGLLVTAPLEGNDWFPTAEFSPPPSFLGNLKDLRAAMEGYYLTFAGLDSSLTIKANAYGPEFIPFFFDPFIFPGTPTTFQGLLNFSQNLVADSEIADTGAASSIGQLDLNLQSLAQRLNDIHEQYNSQLGQLCGWKSVDINGTQTRVPDIDGAILPPEQRPNWMERNRGDQGEIGLQWLEIDAAEQAMERALLDLENVIKVIDQKRETWRLIKDSREDMIQNVIIATGEKIDQLNKDSIEAKAKFAEYQARLAKKKKKRGLFSSIFSSIPAIAAVVAAPFTGGASLLTIAGGALDLAIKYDQISADYKNASSAIDEFKTQAQVDRRLGEIEAKKQELAYLERAGIQFQQIEEDGYRTEEAIHSLLLETKSAELQIEIADLRVDREYTKLTALLNRVSFLTQQRAASFSLADSNPLNSPDFRVIRDRNVREAEERFLFAQEWAFLTGRAASYVALGSTRRTNIENINTDILKARTGKRLNYLLDRLNSEMSFVSIDLGSRASQKVTVSLRDQLVQHNNVDRSADGSINSLAAFPWESQTIDPGDGIISGNSEEISDAAWLEFLQANLVRPGGPSSVLQLRIPFRLSLNRWATPNRPTSLPKNQFSMEAPFQENPLFSANRRGAVIFFSASNPEFFGTRVDVMGNISNINPSSAPVSVRLSPEGASYIREESYQNDPSGQSIRVFELGSNTAQATIEASINGVGLAGSGQQNTNRNAQLHERSPANDRWILTIDFDGTPNRRLIEQLDKIRDIRVSFSLSSF